jgi:hypothetical protein
MQAYLSLCFHILVLDDMITFAIPKEKIMSQKEIKGKEASRERISGQSF